MNRIKELRQSLSLTQQELAEMIGFNQTVIGKYERNELEPNLETLKKLSKIFECSIDSLIGHSDDFGTIIIKNGPSGLTSEEQELLNNYRSLPAPERAQASEYVNFLTERRGIKNKHA